MTRINDDRRLQTEASGDTPETLERVARLYERVVKPGVFRCSSVKAAVAGDVTENTQPDLNIALMNDLAITFDLVGLDASEVLQATGTKWNSLKFKPGVVGGALHRCRSVLPDSQGRNARLPPGGHDSRAAHQ